MSVDRPNKQGACPSGTTPCSNSTDIEHTVCYASADHKKECPIIDLKFVTSASEIAYYTDNPEWETEAGMSNYVLVYTRSDANKLPVTATQIAVNPCLKPDSWESPRNGLYYPLERQLKETCELEMSTKV